MSQPINNKDNAMPISSISMKEIPFKKIAVAVTLSLLLSSCGASKDPESAKENTDNKEQPTKATVAENIAEPKGESGMIYLSAEELQQSNVTITKIQPEKLSDQLILSANITANQDRIAFVAPRVEGKLIKVTVNLGDQVKAGQSLAVIDSIQMGEARAEYRHA